MNNKTFLDSYLLNENNSINSKNLLLTLANKTNLLYTNLKPFDLILINFMLENKLNTSVINCSNYITACINNFSYIFVITLFCYHLNIINRIPLSL